MAWLDTPMPRAGGVAATAQTGLGPLVLRASNGVLEASDYLSPRHDWVQLSDERVGPFERAVYEPPRPSRPSGPPMSTRAGSSTADRPSAPSDPGSMVGLKRGVPPPPRLQDVAAEL